MSECVLSTF